jgi:hypothetical protein
MITEAEAAAGKAGNVLLRAVKMLDTQDRHTKGIEKQAEPIEALNNKVRV